jgi:hypothetical protein
MGGVPAFDDEHLEMDLTIPESEDEVTFPDVYVGLEIGLLVPGDGIVTDRHHASGERYRPDDPLNQTEGQLTSFQMSGWLRHGCERVLQVAGATACHPGEPDAEFMLDDVYERHKKLSYVEVGGVDWARVLGVNPDKVDLVSKTTEFRSNSREEVFPGDREADQSRQSSEP